METTSSDLEEVQLFLQRYGYLDIDADIDGGSLDQQTSKALASYQKFTGKPASGEFDQATRRVMACPRCAMPDFNELEFRVIGAWDRRDLTYAFGNLTSQPVGDAAARDAVRAAFDTWAAAGVGLTFREVATDELHDIQIEWRPARDPDLSMRGGALAHADFPPGYSLLVESPPLPLHFDDDEHTWATDGTDFDIETVALHEIGHLLGMLHEPVNTAAVMFPNYEGVRRTLHPDDLAGLRTLYPPE